MRRGSWLALALTAAVGAAAGVLTALVGPIAGGPAGGGDPLNLGVDLVDQACTGRAILILAHGDGTAPLSVGVGDSDEARYLRVADSCPTLYASPEKGVPAYAAYLGPYDDVRAACEVRMTEAHRGNTVTLLRAGNAEFVRCACSLPSTSAPVLRPGVRADSLTALWVRQLQGMLADIPGGAFGEDDVSGVYDPRTQGRIAQLQRGAGLGGPYRTVDAATWGVVKARACNYSY